MAAPRACALDPYLWPPQEPEPPIPAQGLSLEQSVSQFSHTMTAQADLRVEAAHLRRFLHNFRVCATLKPGRPTAAVFMHEFPKTRTAEKCLKFGVQG